MKHTSKQFLRAMKALKAAADEHDDLPEYKIQTAAGARFAQTDVGNADRLMIKYGSRMAFTPAAGWAVFDGKRWDLKAGTTRAMGVAGEVARPIFYETAFLNDAKDVARRIGWAEKSGRASSMSGMLKAAEAAMLVPLTDFDKNPYLWNCPNGTVDLRTGELRDFDADDMLTGMSPVAYDAEASCPTWEASLDDIFLGNREEISFIQRLVGYSMLGDQPDGIAVFLTGDEYDAKKNGSNGKTVFQNVLHDFFGEYATGVDRSLIVEDQKKSGINSDVAALAKARLGIGSEFKKTDVLSDREYKRLTGDDLIKARFLHKEFFDFRSPATLFYSTNYIPLVTGRDDGVWRRMVIVKFLAKFYDEFNCPPGGKQLENQGAGDSDAEFERMAVEPEELDDTRRMRVLLDTVMTEAELDPRDKQILFRYNAGETYDAIGASLGISRERVRQVRGRCLEKVLACLKRRGLSLEDLI